MIVEDVELSSSSSSEIFLAFNEFADDFTTNIELLYCSPFFYEIPSASFIISLNLSSTLSTDTNFYEEFW